MSKKKGLCVLLLLLFMFYLAPKFSSNVTYFQGEPIEVEYVFTGGGVAESAVDSCSECNSTFVNIIGDTMTGNLISPNFLGQWNGSALYLPLSGGTMTGPLKVDSNINVTGNLTIGEHIFTPTEHLYSISTTVQAPTGADIWQNITYNMSVGDQEHMTFENDNQTVIANVRGHYTITLGTFTIDSSPSPSADVAFRILKNGEQAEGTYVPIKMRLQNAVRFQEHTTHLTDVEVGDKFKMQWITSDADVSLDATTLYSDRQKTTSYVYIQRISGMEL